MIEDDDKINDYTSHDNYTEFQRTNPLGKNIEPLEVYAEHAEIRKQVHDEIRKLYTTLDTHKLHAVDITIDRFLNCLSPLKQLHDPGRLPVYTTVPRSTIPDKQSCVWALVSCLVQAYWEYELGDAYEITSRLVVGKYLAALIAINEHYPEMKITGAENKGWWLEL